MSKFNFWNREAAPLPLESLTKKFNVLKLEKDAAERRANQAEEALLKYAEVNPRTAMRRVGFVELDPIKLTARVRTAVEGAKVEFTGTRLWLYVDREITDAELRTLEEKMSFSLDLT